jgi:FAD/FMN-containing dehydrogenase
MNVSTLSSRQSRTAALAGELVTLLGDPARVLTAPAVVERLSRDFYWYSPVLRKLLDGKTADLVVQPTSAEEVQSVLAFARDRAISVTARGAGTGNYGQAVPLEGGIVLDLSLFDKLEEITSDGVAVCQPGLRLGQLEIEAGKEGWELRCYPSTIAKASVGGFLGGGSGGIGSVAHGGLRDFQTVRALEIVTMEDPPRVVRHDGESVHSILHAWGTNGIITRIWLALTPAVAWSQAVVAFASFDDAFSFGERIAKESAWTKRLVSVFEWPIPSFFTPIRQVLQDGSALIFVLIATEQAALLAEEARAAGGHVTLNAPYAGLRTQPLLSDYTWNHTTLWAMKADPAYTYLQCGFSSTTAKEQFRSLRDAFGQEILFHIEFIKTGDGIVIPGAIPVVRYTTEQRLDQMIEHCRGIGVIVANPHVNNVEGGGRYRADHVQLKAKQKYDPCGLLNPGKMSSFAKEVSGQ